MNKTVQDNRARLAELIGDDSSEHHALRMRILDVASDHFARFGYRKANVGEMARDVGIGKGSMYLHFDSKKTLLVAAIAREKMALMEPFAALMAGPAAERLRGYVEMSLRFVLNSPLTGRLMRGDPEIDRIAAEYGAEHPDEVEQGIALLASLVQARMPNLPAPEARERAVALRAALYAVAHVTEDLLLDQSTEVFIRTYTDILIHGFQA